MKHALRGIYLLMMEEILANIEKYRDQFYRFVLRSVWDSSVAEDVFASAVLAAYENRHKYTPETNFRAWMFRILVNKCFVANRETKRAFEPLNDGIWEHVAADQDVSAYIDVVKDPKTFLEQCGDEVYNAFRHLSTAQRSCILLKDAERFSYKEIADILGIPVATVMTHLARGRAILRVHLTDYARRTGIVRSTPRILQLREDIGEGQGPRGSAAVT
jgi:RNA polymerase sigma-70 factor (ECF subfamily)